MVKVFAVHTALAMVEPTTELFKKHLPDVKLNHIVDDSLIQEVIINNMVTPSVAKRLMNCFFMAVDAGADYFDYHKELSTYMLINRRNCPNGT